MSSRPSPDPKIWNQSSAEDDSKLRRIVAKLTGQAVETVDLDAPLFTSGDQYRRYRRAGARDQARRKRKGQRQFNRQLRAHPEPEPSNNVKVRAARIERDPTYADRLR